MSGMYRFLNKTKGQSLVEVAILLPILIIVLVGVVEVTNLLNTQNRVTTASRQSAGFGSSNFDRDDWPGVASAMGNVALATVTDTLTINPDLWDVWAIHAITNDDGSGFDVFTSTQVYGSNQVVNSGEWTTMDVEIQADVLAALQNECPGGFDCAADIEVVVSVPFYNLETILGLDIWQWTGLKRVRGLTVMRIGTVADYLGCPILPITIRLEQYSLYPSNWPEGVQNPVHDGRYPDDWVDLFPDFGTQMASPPTYVNESTEPLAVRTSTYPNNVPGLPLYQKNGNHDFYAPPGSIFWAREGSGPGNFGWLTWRGSTAESILLDSLLPPGDFLEEYPGSPADMNTVDNGSYGPTGDKDGYLIPGEWLEGATGNMNNARDRIQEYIDTDYNPNLVVFDTVNDLTGSGMNFRVIGFATVDIIGYKFQALDKWIAFEIVQWPAENCIPDPNDLPAYP